MKPFKNILMLPHPFPTIWIGHMKLCLYHTFLSLLLLSGCGGSSGGGGDSTSSSKKAKAAKVCTTPIPNGKGELPWNTKTKKYSTTCKVVSCNAGYDNVANPAQCGKTQAGYYSLAKDKTRKKCLTTFPPHSLRNTATGTKSETDCWNCKAGSLKNTSNKKCTLPGKGKYYDAQGNLQSCNDVGETPSGGFSHWENNTAPVASNDKCEFSCNSGFTKSESLFSCNKSRSCPVNPVNPVPNGGGLNLWDTNTDDFSTTCTVETCDAGYDNDVDTAQCQQTASGFYSPANDKARTACPTPPHSSATTTTELSSADGCYTCDGGYLKNTASSTCDVPSKGTYVNASGTEVSCNPITTLQGGATATWIRGAAATADACPFSCSPGFVKTGRACNIPGLGKYADSSGDEQSCNNPTGGFNTFLLNTGAVDSATDCGFSCNAGFVKKTVGRTCATPDTGKYADSSGNEQSCDNPTGAASGFDVFLQNTGAVDSADGCDFSCNAGFVKDSSARECNYPTKGKYVNAGNTESPCTAITTEGTAVATWIVGAASTDTACPFSCTAGYVKDTSAGGCKYPTQGTYVDSLGAEVSCTDISGTPNFGAWVSGAATDADSCPFSCASGYTISGRMCNKARPQTLALGKDTSRVLFDNGEVESWGKVSAFPWRSHIKEDLGGHTSQALVSGRNHQCIILKNGNLNHGRLMCWGQNSNRQLGVGDTSPRSTPTAVTAVGNDGDGNPNTVKSVAVGREHTCAILNDDTVKCWGRNNRGQSGGGTAGANKTKSGTSGSPLGSGTASHIAAGEFHTCAILTTDNSVKCWGYNHLRQTGGGTPSLGSGKTATKIAIGGTSSCATLNDASVVCWGYLGFPVLGVGKTATKITLGAQHGCVLLSDKTVKCWGVNDNGEIGGGTSGPDRVLRGTAGDPLVGQTAIQIAASYDHTCAIMESGNSVKCWGKNFDAAETGFYGKIVGEVAMTGGSDGTGTSTGETATLTAVSTPTATALEADAGGKICALAFTGRTLGGSWILKEYSTPLTYNTGGSTMITNVIDSLIAKIGSPVNMAGTNVTLAKKGNDKIEATVNSAVFNGLNLTIYHDDDGGNCTRTRVEINIPLTGGSGAAGAEGLWVISEDYTGTGDKTVNLDSVHTGLGNSNLTKEEIADKIVAKVNDDASWAGKQNVDLPYTATKLDGSTDPNDDCPDSAFCVVFDRVFKGTEGNYGIPFGDSDYSHLP